MRQGHNKRMRGRNRRGPSPLSRSYESNGPDVKIRGTALHIADKYVMLARDASSSDDRVAEQSYLQHAEHYYRIVATAQAQMPQIQPVQRPEDEAGEDGEERMGQNGLAAAAPPAEGRQPASGVSDQQPQTNGGEGNGQDEGANDAGIAAGGFEGSRSDGEVQGHTARRPNRPRSQRVEAEASGDDVGASTED
jgi:hypothetical protein